jgi:hypothetical protein
MQSCMKRCKFVLQIMHVLLLEYGKRLAIFNQKKKRQEDERDASCNEWWGALGPTHGPWSMVYAITESMALDRWHSKWGKLAQYLSLTRFLFFVICNRNTWRERERSITVGVGERERERERELCSHATQHTIFNILTPLQVAFNQDTCHVGTLEKHRHVSFCGTVWAICQYHGGLVV